MNLIKFNLIKITLVREDHLKKKKPWYEFKWCCKMCLRAINE